MIDVQQLNIWAARNSWLVDIDQLASFTTTSSFCSTYQLSKFTDITPISRLESSNLLLARLAQAGFPWLLNSAKLHKYEELADMSEL